MTDCKPSKCRVGISGLLLLQLLVAPAFLTPVLHRAAFHHKGAVFLGILIGSMCYVAVFSYRTAVRVLSQRSGTKPSVVFAAIRKGALFGVLFSAMALGPSVVLDVRDTILRCDLRGWEIPLECLGKSLLLSVMILYFALLGAASGGAVGLAVDKFHLCSQRHEGVTQTTAKD